MVKVEFLGPINKESIDLDIKNLSELSNILKNDEKYLLGLKLVQLL